MEMPMSFNTELGDHGVRLLGRQTRPISSARTLLKHPSILILDEATSMYRFKNSVAIVGARKTELLVCTVSLINHGSASLALVSMQLLAPGRIMTLECAG
jgi:ABC-type multidrug transport system fused ATPase/permease subunit